MCNFDGCDKRASFNQKGERTPLFCTAHKKEGMVDVINKTCVDCNVRPQKKSLPLFAGTSRPGAIFPSFITWISTMIRDSAFSKPSQM